MCLINDPKRGSHTLGWECGQASPPAGNLTSHGALYTVEGFRPRSPAHPNLCHFMHEIPQDHSLLSVQMVPWLPMWLRVKVQIQKVPGLQSPQGLAHSLSRFISILPIPASLSPLNTHTSSYILQDLGFLGSACPEHPAPSPSQAVASQRGLPVCVRLLPSLTLQSVPSEMTFITY